MSEEVIVTCRRNGERFRIVSEGESPDGSVALEECAPAHTRLWVRGSQFTREFHDPRKCVPMCERCRADNVIVGRDSAGYVQWACANCSPRPPQNVPAQNALDASDIPTWTDLMAERREKVRARTAENAAKILDAVRAAVRAVRGNCQGNPCGPLSVGAMSLDAVHLANEKLAPRGWRVEFNANRDRLVLETLPETATTNGDTPS